MQSKKSTIGELHYITVQIDTMLQIIYIKGKLHAGTISVVI